MRGGIRATTTTAIVQDSYEMSTGQRGRPFDGTVSVSVANATEIKRKPMDDGLSLRSDSDGGVEDAVGNRQKFAGGEASPTSNGFPVTPVQPRVQVQVDFNDVGPDVRHP